MDTPQPFIEITGEGEIKLQPKPMQFLHGIDKPVTVISLIGKYRTGKSFLLNRFFGENYGFPVGSSVQTMTRGIWIWARQHPLDPSSFLILLDTEGLHDAERNNAMQDMQIFSLALLLSSCCIYNVVGTIDEVLIKQLNLVVDLTEHIHVRPEEEEDGNQFSKYFPSLVVMLRDFFLDLKIDEESCTPDEYLENALKLKKGPDSKNRKLKNYNMPRECIRTFFPKRRCFALCRPVNDTSKLVKVDQLPPSELNPDFLESCYAAVNAILEQTRSYEVGGFVMTGPRYAQLVQTYIDSMNNKEVPCITNAVKQLQQSQCQIALEEAVGIFDDHMTMLLKDVMPVSLDELATANKAAQTPAIEHFKRKALFDKGGQFFRKLSEAINSNFRNHVNKNTTQSQYNCREALTKCFASIESNIRTERYHTKGGYSMYLQDKERGIAEYEATPKKGPLANEELQNYLEKKHSTEDALLCYDKAIKSKEKEIEQEKQERQRQEGKERRQREANERMAKEILFQQEANQEILKKLQDAYEQQQRKCIEDHARDIDEKNEELKYFRDHGLERQTQEYEEIIKKMEEDKETMETDYKEEKEKIGKLSEEHAMVLSQLREMREFDQKELEKFQKSMNARWEASSSGGGGITEWISSVISGTVDWLCGTDKTADTASSQPSATATINGKGEAMDTSESLVAPDVD